MCQSVKHGVTRFSCNFIGKSPAMIQIGTFSSTLHDFQSGKYFTRAFPSINRVEKSAALLGVGVTTCKHLHQYLHIGALTQLHLADEHF